MENGGRRYVLMMQTGYPYERREILLMFVRDGNGIGTDGIDVFDIPIMRRNVITNRKFVKCYFFLLRFRKTLLHYFHY